MADQIISRLLLGLDTREFRNGIRNADRDLEQFGKNVKNIGNIIGASFAVGVIQDFTMEAVKLGDQLSAATKGFERFGSAADLEKLKTSTKGMVSEVQLLQQAVQAGNFGIPIEELGNLFAFAQQRAKETGQEVDYLTQSIVTGIGRKSPLILDNLGISAVQLKEKLGGVSAEAASIADVTRAVASIAKEQLGLMGDATVSATDRIKQYETQWQDLKAKLGQDFAPAIISIFDTIAAAAGRINDSIGGIIQTAAQIIDIFFGGGGMDFSETQATGKYLNRIGAKKGPDYKQQYYNDTGNKKASTDIEKTTAAIGAQATEVKKVTTALIDYGEILERIGSINTQVGDFFTDLNADLFSGTLYWFEYGDAMADALDTSALEDFMTYHQDMESEIIPGIENIVTSYDQLNKTISATASVIGNVLQASFEAALVNGEDFFKVLLDGLKKMAIRLAATAAAAFALSIALKSMGIGSGASLGNIFKVVGGQMGIPGLGGSSFNPTTGAVEGGLFGGRTTLRGNDIYLANSRSGYDLGRIG
jgi:hypothetical protein